MSDAARSTVLSAMAARPSALQARLRVLLWLLAAGAAAWWWLGLSLSGLIPQAGGLEIARQFFSAALSPALDYQADFVPDGSPVFLWSVAQTMGVTLLYAAASLSLAVTLALPLSFFASSAAPIGVRVPLRAILGLARSVHELLWAVLFLAAFGMNSASAIVAIALPFAGTLAKVWSEMLDETSPNAARALELSGARTRLAFVVGRAPLAFADMAAYGFYRLECSVRASAVLGFFGYPTAGYFLKLSFENLHYREVWTWLYALLLIVLLFEAWSARLRKRFVA